MADLSTYIRNIPDFPKKGIGFKDITTLLKDANAFNESVEIIAKRFEKTHIDKIVGTESRGFIFGAALAYKMKKGFVPVRKPGKLPAETINESYELEYGTDSLEIHKDAVNDNEKVLIVDDLLATGGTAKATAGLVEQLGGQVVAFAFLIELSFLNGKDKLAGYDVFSIIKYDGE